MSMSSSGSFLCRRLWIKRLCHDIIHSHYSRTPFLATLQQTRQLSSQVNYQPPPTFLTPSHIPTTATITTATATATTPFSRKVMEKRILELVKSSQVDDAHRILADIYRSGHTPTIVMYNHMIKALAKQFRNQQCQLDAHTLLDDMARHGVPPNAQTYIQLLLGYTLHTSSSSKCIDTILPKMQLLINGFIDYEHQHNYKRTQQKIKKLVDMMAGVGHKAILPLMEATVKAGVSLDLATWHVALSGCTKGGDLDMAEQLLDIMQVSWKNQQQQQEQVSMPDATAYDIVIDGYLTCRRRPHRGSQQGMVVNMDRAIELFQRMMDDGIVADYRTYEKFLRAYTGMTKRTVVTQHDDNNNSSSNAKLDMIQRLWQAMIKTMPADKSFGDDTLVMVLECYLQNQQYSAMEQVYWDLRQQQQHNYTLSRRSAIYFYKAISGFAQQQHLISGIAMFYDLLMYGHGANHSATSSLLRACILRGQLDMAQQILDVMEETLNTPAHVDHYATILKAYVEQGQLDMASKMFTKVQQFYHGSISSAASLSPFYQAMIRGYFKGHQNDMAESLFNQWMILQQKINKSSIDERMIDVMVEGYGLLGDTGKLDQFVSRSDVDISSIRARTILIQARLQQGNVEGAERDLKDGLEMMDIKTMESSVQAVLSGMALNGNVAACEYWANLLSAKGLMNDESYMALLVCYGKAGEKVKLQRVYDDLNQRGIQLEDGIENKVKLEWLTTDVYT